MEGWIKLHRQLLDTDLWKGESFTRGQAWVDLVMMAAHKETSFRKRGIKIQIYRGQVGKSLDDLSKRWQWSKGKVKRFLIELENETQITTDCNNVNQIITIVNYDKYQGDSNANEYADETANNNANGNADEYANYYADRDADGTQTEHRRNTNGTQYKNEKNNNIPLPRVREEVNLRECYSALLNSQSWWESFCMNNHLAPSQFKNYLHQF